MTARLDARQLDQVWDAQVLGERFPLPVDDLTERELFELLAETVQATPSASFVRELERELALASGPEPMAVPPIALPLSKPHISKPAPRRWNRPRSRWMTAGYALAAIALVVFLSTFAIVQQRSGDDNGPSIPAVSEWNDDGPPTSPGVERSTLFSHTFSVDELADYSFDQWGWAQFMRGTVQPGQRSHFANGSSGADTMFHPGISFIEVERGQLAAHLAKPALVGNRSSGDRLAPVAAGTDVTLEVGETLVFGLEALAEFWNPADSEAGYVAGGLYSQPTYPINFPESKPQDLHTGTSFDASSLAGVDSLNVAIDQVSIGPGETFAYAITSQTLLLADVTGDGLIKRAWSNGVPDGREQHLLMSTYSLHNVSAGYYTLTNTSSQTVDVYLLRVAPPVNAQPAPDAPAASVESLFDHAFSQSDLAPYQLDQWGWIQFLHAELDPGHQWPVIDGSNATPTPGWPGLSVVGVVSGQLTARLSKPILISRAGAETLETVAAPADVILAAGDSILFEPGAVESIWNLSEDRAELVDGGLYDRPHYASQTTGTGALDIPGGSSFDPAVLAGSFSLDLFIRKISIAPGEDYRYTITSRTLLLADVRGDGLQKTAWADGTPGDTSQRLLVSKYTLHNDNPGDYRLTNTGEAAVDVYFFGVSALSGAEVVASPTAQGDGKG